MHYSRVIYGVLAILALTTAMSCTNQPVDATPHSSSPKNGEGTRPTKFSRFRTQIREIISAQDVQEIQQCIRDQNAADQSGTSSSQLDANHQDDMARRKCSRMYTVLDENDKRFTVKVPYKPSECIRVNYIIKKLRDQEGGAVFPQIYSPINTKAGWGIKMEDFTEAQHLDVYLKRINTASQQGRYNLQIQRLFSQILKGIELLHNSNYVHGDLRPESILVVPNQQERDIYDAKIIDFSWTRPVMSNKVNKYVGKFLKKSPFDAPESKLSRESDHIHLKAAEIWALGAVFYYSLVRDYVPINSQTGEVVLEKIKNEKLRILLAKMLRLDPFERCTASSCLELDYFTTSTTVHNK